MKNPMFSSDGIKREYRELLSDKIGLSYVIDSLIELYGQVKIIDIIAEENNTQIIVETKNDMITVLIDYTNSKIKVFSPKTNFATIYDAKVQGNMSPLGWEYKSNSRVLFKKNFDKNNGLYGRVFSYVLIIGDSQYNILVQQINNKKFNEMLFISSLLNERHEIKTIRDLLIVISHLDIDGLEIKALRMDDKGSTFIIADGQVSKYIEFIEKENEVVKIFLENGKFYQETTVREEINGNILSLVKRR